MARICKFQTILPFSEKEKHYQRNAIHNKTSFFTCVSFVERKLIRLVYYENYLSKIVFILQPTAIVNIASWRLVTVKSRSAYF